MKFKRAILMRNKSGNDPIFSRDLLYSVNTLIHTQESEYLSPLLFLQAVPSFREGCIRAGICFIRTNWTSCDVHISWKSNILVERWYIQIPILPFNQNNNKQTSLQLRSHGYIQPVLQPSLSLKLTDLNGKQLGWSDLHFHGTLYDSEVA